MTSWVRRHWGSLVTLPSGLSALRELSRGILERSRARGIFRRLVYGHIGWRQIDGRWAYLSSSGALGFSGVEVELDNRLAAYCLPLEPRDLAAAMRASLDLWQLGPLHLTVPLWGAMFGAPFTEWLSNDYSLWIEGQTQILKTSTALVFLSHFGSFGSKAPAAWLDSFARLEWYLNLVKDAPLLIDDFVREREGAEQKATDVLRAQGNRVSRGRMRSSLEAREDRPPRGLLLSTAEHRPQGMSLSARMLVLPFSKGLISEARLTQAQERAGRLRHAMAGFLLRLGQRAVEPGFQEGLRTKFETARKEAGQHGGLLRAPEIVARVWVGVSAGLDYAEELGVLSSSEAERMRAEGWEALLGAKVVQDREVESERETRRFLDALWGLVAARKVVLLDKSDSGEGYAGRSELVGWRDSEMVMLNFPVAYTAVSRALRDSGRPLRAEENRMKAALREDGLIEPGEDKDNRLLKKVRVGGQPQRLLCLIRDKVAKFTGETGWRLEAPQQSLSPGQEEDSGDVPF